MLKCFIIACSLPCFDKVHEVLFVGFGWVHLSLRSFGYGWRSPTNKPNTFTLSFDQSILFLSSLSSTNKKGKQAEMKDKNCLEWSGCAAEALRRITHKTKEKEKRNKPINHSLSICDWLMDCFSFQQRRERRRKEKKEENGRARPIIKVANEWRKKLNF